MREVANIRPEQPVRIERPAASRNVDALLAQLRPGQTLSARVIEARAGQALLRIGDILLTARSPGPLTADSHLDLRVEQGLPHPILRILQRRTARPPPAQTLLRHALARQQPALPLRTLFARLPGAITHGATPAATAIASLNRSDIEPARLDAQTVKAAFMRSGLFLEARLAKGLSPDTEDRKLHLLHLRRALLPEQRASLSLQSGSQKGSSTPGKPDGDQLLNRLLASIEGELGRIQQHQVRSLPGDDPQRQIWQFTLPLRDDTSQSPPALQIERHARDTETETDETTYDWRVEIRFDFGDLGAVSARLSLQDGRIRCAFHSQRADTARRFAQALPRLDERLHAAGLQVAALTSLEATSQTPDPGLPAGLLDERA